MSLPEDNFEKLQKLLAGKRYEQPPPGYFHFFSEQVIARLEAGEQAGYSSWWEWLVAKFDAKPVLACAYGAAISGLLLTGFSLAQVFEAEASANEVLGRPWLAATPDPTPFIAEASDRSPLTSSLLFSTDEQSSLAEARPLLFQGGNVMIRPASFGAIGY